MPKQTNGHDAIGKELTRERILTAATGAFADQGYHGTSMDDIVQRSGTSKGAIYFHFPGKETLFCTLIEKLADILENSARNSISRRSGAAAQINAALQTLVYTLSHHRRLAKMVLVGGLGLGTNVDQRLMNLHQRFAVFIKKYLDHAATKNSMLSVDTEVVAYIWLGAINEIAVRWLHTGKPEPLESIISPLRDFLLRSIGIQPVVETPAKDLT